MLKSTPFLIAAAILAGLGIGFLAGGGIGSPADRGEPFPAEESFPSAARGEGEESVEVSSPPGGEPSPVPPVEGGSELADTLASVPHSEIRAGKGKISGKVLREDGRPLAGVRVSATPVSSRRKRLALHMEGEGPPEDRDLETEVLEMIALDRRRNAAIGTATTDGEGKYALSGLGEGEHELEAVLDGFEIERKGFFTEAQARPGETVDFVARPLIEVKIDVFLPGDRPPLEARIHISTRMRPNRTESWRPDAPTLRFTPGKYTLRGLAGTRDEYSSKEKTVTLEASDPAPPLAFHLEGRRGIRGRVRVPEGFPIRSLYVYSLRQSPDSPADPDRLLEEGRPSMASRNQGYRYSFPDLKPGTYLVGARWTDCRIAAYDIIEVADGFSSLDLDLSPPEPREFVVLKVFGPKGEVLRDVRIETGFKANRYSSSGGGTVTLRPDGSFLIIHRGLGSGRMIDTVGKRFHVTVESNEYGKKEVKYSPRESTEIVVAFEEPARLEVTVAGYAGSGMEGKLGLCLDPRGQETERRSWSFERNNEIQKAIDDEGHRSFGPLEPGAHDVSLHILKGRYSSLPVSRLPVTLRPGENRISIDIPTLYSLTVTVEKTKPAAHVYLEPWKEERDSWSVGEKVGEDGRAVFHQLPEGEYRIAVWQKVRLGEMKVKVPAQSLVRFDPKAKTALQVRIDDPEGYLARVGFQTDDLVIAVEGEEFKSDWHIEALLFGALSKERVTLTVLREGAKLEIEVDPKMIMKDEELGGDLTPTSR
ncbi:MAG: PDZ domain-containing protein [Planctomycetota bacterium]|jgi:hypothetical protein